jgi:hypothetical protein
MKERLITAIRSEGLYLIIIVVASITLGVLFYKFVGLGHKIQTQRKIITYLNCKDQNARHDRTEHFINVQINKLEKKLPKGSPPSAKAELEKNRKINEQFIQIIAPKQDCLALANRAIDPGSNPFH